MLFAVCEVDQSIAQLQRQVAAQGLHGYFIHSYIILHQKLFNIIGTTVAKLIVSAHRESIKLCLLLHLPGTYIRSKLTFDHALPFVVRAVCF